MKTFQTLLTLSLFFISLCSQLSAQVGINPTGTDPDASAMLDISSTDKGMLIPRMNAAQRDLISSPAEGLMVYVTDDNSFYYFNGSIWTKIGGSADQLDSVIYHYPTCEEIVKVKDGSNHVTTGSSQWQSFTSTLRGHLCEVRVYLHTNKVDAGFVRIYEGEGTSGALIYEADVKDLSRPGAGIPTAVLFPEKSVLLQKDSLYTFQLEDTLNSFSWLRRSTNVYSGGTASTWGDFRMEVDMRGSENYPWQDFLHFVIEDLDSDSTNEIQDLSLSGTQLTISKGNSIDLTPAQDNLGNHQATQNLQLKGKWLSNDGNNEGIYVDTDGQVGMGTNNPDAQLDVRSSLKYVDGNQGDGKVLTSDATGNATWQEPGYGKEILECYSYSFSNPKAVASQLTQESGYFLRSFNNGILWQSFTAEAGYLQTINIWTSGGTESFKGGFLNIYQGEGNGGTRVLRKSIGAISGAGTVNVSSNNLLLIEGEKYTLEFHDTNGVWGWAGSSMSNPYAGGRSSTIASRDHKFRVYMAVCEDKEMEAITVNTNDASHNLNEIKVINFADGTSQSSAADPHTMTQNVKLQGNWLSNDGGNEGVFVDTDGNVGIGTNSPDEKLHIKGISGEDGIKFPDGSVQVTAYPQNGYYSVGLGDFVSAGGNTVKTGLSSAKGGSYGTSGSTDIVAPVHLPNGAKITGMNIYGNDNFNTNLRIFLAYKPFTTHNGTVIMEHTSSVSNGLYQASVSPNSFHTVNNTTYSYFLAVQVVGGTWHSAGQLSVGGVVIEYQN